jgi:hypothetical protein
MGAERARARDAVARLAAADPAGWGELAPEDILPDFSRKDG